MVKRSGYLIVCAVAIWASVTLWKMLSESVIKKPRNDWIGMAGDWAEFIQRRVRTKIRK